MRATKIVATLGPASNSLETVRSLADAGVDVFRLNASHGSHEEHLERIRVVRQVQEAAGRHIAILLDLQGPKIRLGRFAGEDALWKPGATFTITTEEVEGNCERASTSYAEFARDVKAGDPVLLNDGAVRLRVIGEQRGGGPVRGGERRSGQRPQGHQPAGCHAEHALTHGKDMADLQFGIETARYVGALLRPEAEDVVSSGLYLGRRTPSSRSSRKSRSRRP